MARAWLEFHDRAVCTRSPRTAEDCSIHLRLCFKGSIEQALTPRVVLSTRRRVHTPTPIHETRPRKGSGSPELGTPQASVGPASSQATASTISHKYRRALKNGTGATLTFLELQLLARLGALDLVTRAENAELMNWQEILVGSSSGAPSPTTAMVGSPPASASVPQNQATDDRAYIKALGLAT